MRRLSVLVGLLLLGLAGCAPPGVPVADPNYDKHGKQFDPPAQGMAALYIMNVNNAASGAPPLTVSIGSRQLGPLASGTWFRIEVAPDNYDVRATGSGGPGWQYVRVGPGDMRFLAVRYADGTMRGDVLDVPQGEGRPIVLAGRRAWEKQ